MILVTGSTGLLGSHLLFYLVKSKPHQKIRALYREKEKINEVKYIFSYLNQTENLELDFNSIEWVNCDLLNLNHVKTVFKNIKKVYHCAAKVSFYKSDYSACLKNNVMATKNVVNICLSQKIKKLCYVSSTAAIGANQEGLTNELNKWQLNKRISGYSISKFKAELEVWRGINEGLNAVIINPCIILGAGNWNSSSLSIFKSISNGLKFYSTGSNAIVDARDVSNCMILMMDSKIHAERFLCVGHNITYRELFNEIAETINVSKPKYKISYNLAKVGASIIEFLQKFKSKKTGISKEMIHSSYRKISYDNKKIKTCLGYEFKTLKETITYSANGKYKVV